ncbi:MAG: family 2 glycosyl transferase [Elusimicrobia bacterium]|nr:MAG: family 2 glycosyl transferase [Elusimicrobiota bacterium]KAF0157305.1 MAG: family 2 glycosyl transferase [Elusimicrobiota bacterium]
MEMEKEKLSVIVPVYTADRYLLEMFEKLCLDGLRRCADPGLQLVVVDDASPLGSETEALVRRTSSWAETVYIRNASNLGYVKSVNAGLAAAAGGLLLLCNSDTRLTTGALERLRATLAGRPSAGMAGPVSNGGFSSALQQCRRGPPPLRSFSPEELARFDEFGRALSSSPAAPAAAGWLLGFCLLIRRAVYEEIGSFDEDFGFGYMEEMDYAIRARRAGWELLAVPDAFVYHGGLRTGVQFAAPNAGSQTGRLFPFRSFFRIMKGQAVLIRKYGWKVMGVPQDAAGAAARGF